MKTNPLENYGESLKHHIERVDFDPENPEHRLAAMKFFKLGRWEIHFKAEWPCVTVPETILFKLAERACKDELAQVMASAKQEYQEGSTFNLHTVTHVKNRKNSELIKLADAA